MLFLLYIEKKNHLLSHKLFIRPNIISSIELSSCQLYKICSFICIYLFHLNATQKKIIIKTKFKSFSPENEPKIIFHKLFTLFTFN